MGRPLIEPNELTVGDFWTWEKSIPGYLPDDYDLTYVFLLEKTPATKIEIEAETLGGGFLVEQTDTNAYTPGDYIWQSFLTDSEDHRITYERGRVVLKPDPVTATVDLRSHNRKCLEAINALLEGRATKDVMSYSIAGRQLSKTPLGELMDLRKYYAGLVSQEDAALAAARGDDDGTLIRGAFYGAE